MYPIIKTEHHGKLAAFIIKHLANTLEPMIYTKQKKQHLFIMQILHLFLIIFVILSPEARAESRDILRDAINEVDANVVFMRHALAPGFGDPNNFSSLDCTTQRNLDEEGRRQARLIGKAIQESSIQFADVLSSEWCRCKETAELLGLKQWSTFSGLNSFFQDYADKDDTLRKLKLKLNEIDNDVILMVTHQVVISAATGVSVVSGGLVAYNSFSYLKKVFRLDQTQP